jgi:PhnB protein
MIYATFCSSSVFSNPGARHGRMFSRMTKLVPRLIVSNTDQAVAFYTAALGARALERYATPAGHVVHAAITIGDSLVSLADESPEWNTPGPASLGGSPVLLTLQLDDPDAVCERAIHCGAKLIIPIADRYYGHREGRIEDPFGHLWILSKAIQTLTPEEIARRMRAEHANTSA